MTDKEALKLAHGYLDRLIRGLNMDDTSEAVQVRDAIKQALAAPVQDASKQFHEWAVSEHATLTTTPPAAQPAPVQEPVFELQKTGWEIICNLDWIQTLPFGTKLYTTPPAAKRPWIGLTDDEIFSVLDNLQRKYNGPPTEDSRVVFALAIEAKLKERNQ
jgi:hypothetical protein